MEDVENGAATRRSSTSNRKSVAETLQRMNTMDVMEVADSVGNQKVQDDLKIQQVIDEQLLRDKSPEAKMGRRKMLIRAAYGEFMCSLFFYAPIFCTLANAKQSHWSNDQTTLSSALVAGFQAIGISFAFSSMSGAQFNSAISFALWLTGKLSNRRCLLYICVQLLASIMGMVMVTFLFTGDQNTFFQACLVQPVDKHTLGRVFATEFFFTFFLTYIAFTVAFEDAENSKKENMSFKTISDSKGLTLYTSTPQSRTGFAPFSIGFTIFSLNMLAGASGGAFNPGRLFGPAIFAGDFDYIFLYWAGEFTGAATAGLLVKHLHRIGIIKSKAAEVSAAEVVKRQ